MTPDFILYGAYGYTGRLCAEQAKAAGLTPLLSGRDPAALATLAAELDLPHQPCALADGPALRALLGQAPAVLHCAGPFSSTWQPMVEACLDLGVHYLDITGEVAVLESILALGPRAVAANSVLLPAVGFDVVPTDCVAATLARALPDATHLDLAFRSTAGSSRGTRRSTIERLGQAGLIRREGRLVEVPIGTPTRDIPFPSGLRTCMAIPWGDLATAWPSTHIPNITTYLHLPRSTIRGTRVLPLLAPFLALAPIQRLLKTLVDRRPEPGPDAQQRQTAHCEIWGEVRNSSGQTRTMALRTPEGYTLTASAAIEATHRVLKGQVAPGAWTPSLAFGPDFAQSLPGVQVLHQA